MSETISRAGRLTAQRRGGGDFVIPECNAILEITGIKDDGVDVEERFRSQSPADLEKNNNNFVTGILRTAMIDKDGKVMHPAGTPVTMLVQPGGENALTIGSLMNPTGNQKFCGEGTLLRLSRVSARDFDGAVVIVAGRMNYLTSNEFQPAEGYEEAAFRGEETPVYPKVKIVQGAYIVEEHREGTSGDGSAWRSQSVVAIDHATARPVMTLDDVRGALESAIHEVGNLAMPGVALSLFRKEKDADGHFTGHYDTAVDARIMALITAFPKKDETGVRVPPSADQVIDDILEGRENHQKLALSLLASGEWDGCAAHTYRANLAPTLVAGDHRAKAGDLSLYHQIYTEDALGPNMGYRSGFVVFEASIVAADPKFRGLVDPLGQLLERNSRTGALMPTGKLPPGGISLGRPWVPTPPQDNAYSPFENLVFVQKIADLYARYANEGNGSAESLKAAAARARKEAFSGMVNSSGENPYFDSDIIGPLTPSEVADAIRHLAQIDGVGYAAAVKEALDAVPREPRPENGRNAAPAP